MICDSRCLPMYPPRKRRECGGSKGDGTSIAPASAACCSIMTSYAVTQRRCPPCDDVTYPVTPSLLGWKIVLGRRRCRARPGRNVG